MWRVDTLDERQTVADRRTTSDDLKQEIYAALQEGDKVTITEVSADDLGGFKPLDVDQPATTAHHQTAYISKQQGSTAKLRGGERVFVVQVAKAGQLRGQAGFKDRFVSAVVDALADKLSDTADADIRQLGEPEQIAERMASLVPRPSPLDAAVGPFYDTAALTGWLAVSRQALNGRVRHRTLLACPAEDGQLFYPVWQFTDRGNTIPHLAEVLGILARGTADSWSWALWLTARVRGELSGKPAWQWLADGGDAERILAAARADAARWAH